MMLNSEKHCSVKRLNPKQHRRNIKKSVKVDKSRFFYNQFNYFLASWLIDTYQSWETPYEY